MKSRQHAQNTCDDLFRVCFRSTKSRSSARIRFHLDINFSKYTLAMHDRNHANIYSTAVSRCRSPRRLITSEKHSYRHESVCALLTRLSSSAASISHYGTIVPNLYPSSGEWRHILHVRYSWQYLINNYPDHRRMHMTPPSSHTTGKTTASPTSIEVNVARKSSRYQAVVSTIAGPHARLAKIAVQSTQHSGADRARTPIL